MDLIGCGRMCARLRTKKPKEAAKATKIIQIKRVLCPRTLLKSREAEAQQGEGRGQLAHASSRCSPSPNRAAAWELKKELVDRPPDVLV